MEAKKPSYEELADQVALLKDKLITLSLQLNDAYNGTKAISASAGNENPVENKVSTELIDSFLHKMKTPLDTIIGLANLLSSSHLDFEERSNLAENIGNCSTELQGLISEFASHNALESHRETVNTQKVSLNELLDELKVKFFGPVFHKGLSLRSTKGLSDEEDFVLTDGTKITQIFTSLINNSLKFTEKGFIEIGYKVVENELKFYVKDSGSGMEKNVKEKLLASHFKLEKVTGEDCGAGLGLCTVKQYVDLLGGSLKMVTENGVGTVFYFTVPYVPAVSEALPAVAKKTIKVLIAEDEEISFLLLKKLLEKGKVEIIRAKNGEEAYEIYKNNPDINLILMDLRMPQVDGYTAAQLIKNESPEIPIIAQSAYSFKNDKENYGNAFNGYISKPVNKREFQLAVNKYIDVALLN